MTKALTLLWQRALPLVSFALILNSAAAPARPFYQAESGGGYLSDIAGDGFYKWNKTRFPIKVYMQSGSSLPGYKAYFPQMLKSCFDEWTNISDGKLSWRLVDDPGDADVRVSWSNNVVEASQGTEAGRTRIYARFNPQTNWGQIDRADMSLLTRLPEREFTTDEVHKAYLHEVGHAFGIAGHSSNRNDIMYYAVSARQPGVISSRDRATMYFLYQQDAQPTMISTGRKANEEAMETQAPQPARKL